MNESKIKAVFRNICLSLPDLRMSKISSNFVVTSIDTTSYYLFSSLISGKISTLDCGHWFSHILSHCGPNHQSSWFFRLINCLPRDYISVGFSFPVGWFQQSGSDSFLISSILFLTSLIFENSLDPVNNTRGIWPEVSLHVLLVDLNCVECQQFGSYK